MNDNRLTLTDQNDWILWWVWPIKPRQPKCSHKHLITRVISQSVSVSLWFELAQRSRPPIQMMRATYFFTWQSGPARCGVRRVQLIRWIVTHYEYPTIFLLFGAYAITKSGSSKKSLKLKTRVNNEPCKRWRLSSGQEFSFVFISPARYVICFISFGFHHCSVSRLAEAQSLTNWVLLVGVLPLNFQSKQQR